MACVALREDITQDDINELIPSLQPALEVSFELIYTDYYDILNDVQLLYVFYVLVCSDSSCSI